MNYFNINESISKIACVKRGIILIHQGTTDIMNHIGLLHYYATKYNKLYLH